jgi:hypothetical protein
MNIFCPNCGSQLGNFASPAFCDRCGFRIALPVLATPQARRRGFRLPLGGIELVGIVVFFLSKMNDAPFPVPTVLALAAMGVAWLLVAVVRRGVTPVAKLAREEGLVGLARAIYDSAIKPLIYGKRGRPN